MSMTYADIVKHHRDRAAACRDSANFARGAAALGNQDASFTASGWSAEARKHDEMAAVLETAALMRPQP